MTDEPFNPLIAAHEIAGLLAAGIVDRSVDTIKLGKRDAIAALALIGGIIDLLEREACRPIQH